MTAVLQAPTVTVPPLRSARLDPAAWQLRGGSALGGLAWGCSPAGAAALDVPLLAGAPCVEAFTGGSVRSGRSGAVHWRDDGHWAFGWLDLPDADTGLADAAQSAYRDIFAALRDCGRPQLLRLWNYLPRINADGGGLERYRQFNIGRQQAFLDAGRDAFAGAPAACALGTAGGGLSLRFLAGNAAPRPLENPRQVPAWRYSTAFGPRSPTFSRAALADAGGGQLALFVSGTAAIVDEQSLHAGDLVAQVQETVRNLRAVLATAQAQCTADFALEALDFTVYVRHAAQADAALAAFAQALGSTPAAVAVQADICRAELLVEIEAQGFAPGALR